MEREKEVRLSPDFIKDYKELFPLSVGFLKVVFNLSNKKVIEYIPYNFSLNFLLKKVIFFNFAAIMFIFKGEN